PIAVMDRTQSARLLIDVAVARRGKGQLPFFVTSANGAVLSLCTRDQQIRSMFLAADVINADGMPLVLASRLKCATPLPERVATTALFQDVARMAELERVSVYFLGATRQVLEEAVRLVRQAYPALSIAGWRDGHFGLEDETKVVADIEAAEPDILWVGMGVPREQAFAIRHRARLTHVGVIKTANGLFKFLSRKRRLSRMRLLP